MKTWHLRFRSTDKKVFEALCSGLKSVETRAATPRYQKMAVGDAVKITCGPETIEKTIASVRVYPSIEALFNEVPLSDVMPFAASIEEAQKEYYGYTGYKEKIAQYGLMALKLNPLELTKEKR